MLSIEGLTVYSELCSVNVNNEHLFQQNIKEINGKRFHVQPACKDYDINYPMQSFI
jgi:hypothetical protein